MSRSNAMKQVLQNIRTGETTVSEVPVPTPQPGTILVQTAASLVSAGTERMMVEFAGKTLVGKARSRPDLVRQVMDKAQREGLLSTAEAAFNRLDQPMPLGYSSAGTIVTIGDLVQGYRVGQRVACSGGGYAVHAEYAIVPDNLITPIPDDVDFESAAFATLGAIALHGFRLAQIQLGERVVVIGLGLLGLLTLGIANAAGCQVLGVDIDPSRVEFARELRADVVLRHQAEDAALSFSHGQGVDAVLICAATQSNDPVELAGAIARDRAKVIAIGAVGLDIPRKVYYQKELSFINSRSYGPGRYDPKYEEGGCDYPIGYVRWTEGRNLEAFVELLGSGRLDVKSLITHRLPIEKAPQAYDLITGKSKEPFVGVLLTYLKTLQGELEAPSSVVEPTQVLPSKVARTSAKVTLGVLGAGNFATAVMLPVLRKVAGVQLVGVASSSGLSAQHAAKKFRFSYAVSDAAQIYNDENINTVAILTRHNLHASQVIAALMAGKHVFCEKPLALNLEELEEIQAVLSPSVDQPPLLTVGFNRRFAPLAQRLGAFISDRKEPLYAHYRVNAGYLPLSHWVQAPDIGGGRIIGEGCHFIDFLTFLVGQAPVSVITQALPDNGHYQEDNLQLTLAFPDGSLGAVTYLANGDKSFPKERVEVFVGGRIAVLNDFRSLELIRSGKRQVVRSRLRQDKGHRAEWEAFAAAIAAGGPPPIPYEHLFSVTRASFAAVESLRSGERLDLRDFGE
jgi:predicted dehydrogenase